MALRVLVSEKTNRRNMPTAAVSPKLRRLTLNGEAVALLDKYDQNPDYVQVLLDDDFPKVCWIRPCKKEAEGAKKLDRPSPKTRSMHISALLTEFNWEYSDTSRFEVTWDDAAGALRIDTNKRIDTPRAKKNTAK